MGYDIVYVSIVDGGFQTVGRQGLNGYGIAEGEREVKFVVLTCYALLGHDSVMGMETKFFELNLHMG